MKHQVLGSDAGGNGSIRCVGLSAGYAHRRVLHDVSLTLTPGDGIVALAGPNGSGKSTLMRCLGGTVRPVEGTVTLDGSPLHALSAAQLSRQIASVPQETVMPYDFTVGELVRLGAEANTRQEAAHDRAERAMHDMDLERLAARSVVTLSGGERQRAAVARALAQETPYLLLDEPTAHLDPRHQYQLFETLRRRTRERGCTVLIVLHDLNSVLALADQVLLLKDGQIAARGAPREILDEPTLDRVYGLPLRRLENETGATAITLPESPPGSRNTG